MSKPLFEGLRFVLDSDAKDLSSKSLAAKIEKHHGKVKSTVKASVRWNGIERETKREWRERMRMSTRKREGVRASERSNTYEERSRGSRIAKMSLDVLSSILLNI